MKHPGIQARADKHASLAAIDLVSYLERHWQDHEGGKRSIAKAWLRQAWLYGYRSARRDAAKTEGRKP